MSKLNLEPELSNSIKDYNLIENTSLKCPKCQEVFTISDFENSELSKAHYEHFVQKLTEHTKIQIEKDCELKLTEKYQLELQNKITQINLDNTKEFNLKFNQFSTEKANLVTKYNDELNKVNSANQELKSKIANLELEKNKEIAEQLNLRIKESNKEKENLVTKYNDELNKVNSINQELKSKIANLELVKEKQIAEQINLKNQEFNKEKENLVTKYNDELNKAKEEIHKLERENEKNKLINNKIQGDNLEQEIEELLTKTFLIDSISKITAAGKKADLRQKVNLDGSKEYIGTIAYEIKSTKDWSNNWEMKFLDDMRKENARYGVITATAFATKHGNKLFAISEVSPNIYLCSHENVDLVAQIIRMFILTEYRIENANKSNTELEQKIFKLKEWKKIEFPTSSAKIKNAIENLEKVKVAISNQISPLERNINIIKDNFINEIEQILNSLIV